MAKASQNASLVSVFWRYLCLKRSDQSYMSRRLERLLQLDELLRTSQRHTTTRLAAVLEVSEKTVRNDLNFLRDRYGAPVECTCQRGYHYTDANWRAIGDRGRCGIIHTWGGTAKPDCPLVKHA